MLPNLKGHDDGRGEERLDATASPARSFPAATRMPTRMRGSPHNRRGRAGTPHHLSPTRRGMPRPRRGSADGPLADGRRSLARAPDSAVQVPHMIDKRRPVAPGGLDRVPTSPGASRRPREARRQEPSRSLASAGCHAPHPSPCRMSHEIARVVGAGIRGAESRGVRADSDDPADPADAILDFGRTVAAYDSVSTPPGPRRGSPSWIRTRAASTGGHR